MEIEEALTIYVLSQSGLTALIGRRFFFDEAPEKEQKPYIVCLNISDVKDHVFGAQEALERPVFQFSCYADTKLDAKAVAKQIKAAFYNKESNISGLTIQYAKLLNELSTKYMSPDGTKKIDVTDLEYEIWYERND
jgi:hypothetical protein